MGSTKKCEGDSHLLVVWLLYISRVYFLKLIQSSFTYQKKEKKKKRIVKEMLIISFKGDFLKVEFYGILIASLWIWLTNEKELQRFLRTTKTVCDVFDFSSFLWALAYVTFVRDPLSFLLLDWNLELGV